MSKGGICCFSVSPSLQLYTEMKMYRFKEAWIGSVYGQSWIEIEYHSITYFEHIVVFDVL